MSHQKRLKARKAKLAAEAMAGKNDFNAQDAIQKVQAENDGVAFDNKVKESICRSTYVQEEIKKVLWSLLKERIAWLVLGAFSFVALGLLKELVSKLISKI